MKRTHLIAVSFLFLFLLCACGQAGSIQSSSANPRQSNSKDQKSTITASQFLAMLKPLGYKGIDVSIQDIAAEFSIPAYSIQECALCKNDHSSLVVFFSFTDAETATIIFNSAVQSFYEGAKYQDAHLEQTSGNGYDKVVADASDYDLIGILSRVENTMIFGQGYTDNGDNMDKVNPALIKAGY